MPQNSFTKRFRDNGLLKVLIFDVFLFLPCFFIGEFCRKYIRKELREYQGNALIALGKITSDPQTDISDKHAAMDACYKRNFLQELYPWSIRLGYYTAGLTEDALTECIWVVVRLTARYNNWRETRKPSP